MLTIRRIGRKMSTKRNNNQGMEDVDQEDKNQNVVGFIFDPSTYKIMVGLHRKQEEVVPILSGHIRKGENRWGALAREAREETEGSRLYLLNTILYNLKSRNIFDYFKTAHFRHLGHVERFYGFLLEAEDPKRLKPRGEEISRNRLGVYICDWVGEEDLESSNPHISSFFRKYPISREMISALSHALESYKKFRKGVDRKVDKDLYNPALVKIDLEKAPEELRDRRKYLEKILQR